MAKYRVRAVQRESHKGVFRAGRFWPDTPIDIQVLEGVTEVAKERLQDLLSTPKEDRPPYVYEIGPSAQDPNPKGRIVLKPTVLGENAFKQLLDDGRLTINSLDRAVAPAEVQSEIRKRDAEISDLRAQLEALQLDNARLRGTGKSKPKDDDDDDEDLAVENDALRKGELQSRARIAELERDLVAARGATGAPPVLSGEKAPELPHVAVPTAAKTKAAKTA